MSRDKRIQGPSNKLMETKDLIFVWRLILKNLGFIIVVPAISFLIGYVYTYRLANIYGAKVQLLLKSNETYDYQDPIYKGLGAYGVYMDVQNQMRILRSRDLIGEVIDKIHINTSYYVVGRIKKHEVYETLPFRSEVTVINPDLYEIPIEVRILNIDEYKLMYSVGGKDFTQKHKFNEELVTENFILNLEKRYTFDDENIESIRSSNYEIIFHSKAYLISKYQSALTVENVDMTSVLDVGVTDELQLRAKVFLDTLTAVYIDYSKRIQLEVNQNTLENIERQIDTINIFIEAKERDLLSYKNKNEILNPIREEDEYFAEYVNFSKLKRELEKKRASAIALRENLKATGEEHFLPPSYYIEQNDFYLNNAVSEVRSLQVDLEIKLTHQKEDNENIKNQKKKISMLKQDILDYIKNLLGAIDNEIIIANEFISEYRRNVKQLPISEQGISNIQRELDVNNKMYLFLLERKTNTLIARAGIIPQVRVIESPIMLGVVQPDKTKILRLFVLGGVIFAFLIAVFRKIFFEKIENVNSLAEITDLNIVGGVPFVKKLDKDIMIVSQPKSHVTESFRTIRTNLSFMGNNGASVKTILISSFFPGEGKTFCSSNLANLVGMGDKKTLIIDFDLHRPKIHKTYNIENTKGTSSFIIGKASFNEIIHKEVYPNLDVITAGPIAPNPSELILRREVSDLVNTAKQHYDYIIIDTPPFGLLNDTLELVKKADIFLVVLNTKYTRKRGIIHIEGILSKYNDTSIGVVLNGIKENRLQYYYSKYTYKYTYGYNYGYGYGYDGGYSLEQEK